jgi:hypothetical protein
MEARREQTHVGIDCVPSNLALAQMSSMDTESRERGWRVGHQWLGSLHHWPEFALTCA